MSSLTSPASASLVTPAPTIDRICPSCGSRAHPFVTSKDFNRKTTDSSFDYFSCVGCGLVFMDPIPDDMRPFYEGGFQKIPATLEELRSVAADERYRLEPILRYKKSGKLLEIGPWMGIFSCNAKDAGFDVSALEIDGECVRFLNDVVGVKTTQCSDPAQTLAEVTETFDVIALWHCLEHLPTPWLAVQRAAARLAPGGILLVAIPNIAGNEFASLQARWRHLDAPRHLYFYPPKDLVRLAQAQGLEFLELSTTDELSMRLSREAWHKWAVSTFRIKYLRGAISLLAYHLSRRKARKENSGSGMTAVFRRPVT